VLRIIDGQVFEGKLSADRFSVTLHELGNGHREACVQRSIDWVHNGPLDPDSICAQVLRGEREDPNEEEKLEANRKRSARRAKTKVRRLCKALGVDCLLTLTYRANQTDLKLMKSHFKEFVRRLKTVIPGFAYVAAFEQQERGAWHAHIATHRLPVKLSDKYGDGKSKVKSFNVLRSIWRSVTKGLEGNIDSQNAKPWHSPGRLAAYLSKYMLKAFDDGDDWANRYSGSAANVIPKPVRLEFVKAALGDLIELVVAEVCIGNCDTFTWLSRFGDTFYISTEPEVRRRPLAWGNGL
jgi:hypothetical protein